MAANRACSGHGFAVGEPWGWSGKKTLLAVVVGRRRRAADAIVRHIFLYRIRSENMRTIQEVYRTYYVPRNLQLHMLRVASVAMQILHYWVGPGINERRILRVLLLHDIGNIVKMELTEEDAKSLGVDLAVLVHKKKEFINRYGTDDHVVSLEIARQLGLTETELDLMAAKVFINNENIMASTNYEVKISAYADQRVAPNGVLPLMERLLEAKRRYKNKPGTSMNNPRTDLLIQCAEEIERQVQKYCVLPLNEITSESIHHLMVYLENYKI